MFRGVEPHILLEWSEVLNFQAVQYALLCIWISGSHAGVWPQSLQLRFR